MPRQIAAPLELWVVDVERGFVGAAPPGALAAAVTALARRVAVSGEPEEEVANLAADGSGTPPVVRLIGKPAGEGTIAVASLALEGLRDAEDELTRYDMVMRATRDSISDWNAASGRTWWNQRVYEMLGADPESTTPSYEVWASGIHPEDRDGILRNCEAVVFRGSGTEWQSEYRLLGAGGGERVVLDRGYVQRDASGNLLRVVSVMSDITGERKATAALRESEERFREMTSAINQVFWAITFDHTKTLYVSPAFETIWGLSREELYRDPNNFFQTIHEEDRTRVIAKSASAGNGGYNEVFRIRRPDGTIGWIHDRAFPVRDPNGEVVRIVGVATDITALRDLEQQLAQAQRMESIGRLAGGIAHDFNNLLTVILASARMVTAKLPDDSELQVEFDAIRDAGERAARLTSQLLVFARRHVIAPTELDLTDLARQTERLLRRVIGEHIELETRLATSLGVVIADRAQLEQVLVNLAINARDAMPNGGRLTIETRRVSVDATEGDRPAEPPAGNYVALSVTDTGPGIPSDAVPHVFEPFFTTKPAGEGTGLGLATCYGIIKQARGVILVDTVVGTGTTFTIMLPEVEGNAAPVERRRRATSRKGTGTETILFVEDEPAVRRIGAKILSNERYRVLDAGGAQEALQLAASYEAPIHLLVTDVVMPGMSGTELARRLLQQRPELSVLYTSGYTEESVAHGALEPKTAFLAKPYVAETLLDEVRRLLDV
ncbi:MAG TPA: PAS domain-containing protein [Polyangiaceae bacterium]|nr:PAS domain-containing protein [Polyangiaceae bacterium]